MITTTHILQKDQVDDDRVYFSNKEEWLMQDGMTAMHIDIVMSVHDAELRNQIFVTVVR
jgi:hypothetical protein